MTASPVVDASDLLLAVEEALWFTFLIDLHTASRRNPDLTVAAENLGLAVRELDLVWPRSAADASITPQVLPMWRSLREAVEEVRDRAQTIQGALRQLEPGVSVLDATGDQGTCFPQWTIAAERNREPLVEVWRLLIEKLEVASRAHYPSRLSNGSLAERLKQIREDLVPALSLPVDPHRDPHAFLERLDRKLPEALVRHLTRRIAQTWKVQGSDVTTALKEASERLDLSTRAVKEHYVQPHLWPPMEEFSRPQRVRSGQQYETRAPTAVRAVSSGASTTEDTRKWGEAHVKNANSEENLVHARLWSDDVPIYRTWRWIANRVIGGAVADLVREYGDTGDLTVGAASLDEQLGNDGDGSDKDRTLHELVGARGSGRQLEAVVAQEELDTEIDRVCRMLDVASDQQRQVILARIDPDLASDVNERRDLSPDERELAEADCDGWRTIADVAGISSGGHAHRQYRRAEAKLDD